MTKITRRTALKTAATAGIGVSFGGILHWPAEAAEFAYKFANQVPESHPMTVRAREAAAWIREKTGGQVEIRMFANNQLGGDTDMISQLRSGALEFMATGNALSNLLPQIAAFNAGFVFENYDQVWPAIDGDLGNYLHQQVIGKAGLIAVARMWDNGFRQITTGTKPVQVPSDLQGFKIRVPVSKLSLSLFQSLGASPASLHFAEVYTALQTKLVDGQENPLVLVESAKLYEVQKYCSISNHMWDGFFMLANGRAWNRLPEAAQAVVAESFDQAVLDERADIRALSTALEVRLQSHGMIINRAESAKFREVLSNSGFYATWRDAFGVEVWSRLEKYVGKLA